jgi:oligosaccharyl transferase (archaeosortase A-associated)
VDRARSYELWGVAAAFILGLFLRLFPARNALVEGDILFYSYDSFYHLRRIRYTVDNFPQTLWFDSYLDHPHGLELTWPPLFDQVIAAASLLLGGSDRAVDIAGAVAPPILGSIMIVALYLLAKKLFGTKVALLSAFLLALDPKHIARTLFGLLDHDSLELLLILGAILLLAYALTEKDRWPKFAVPAGILIAATAYTWLGATAYMGAILIYAVVQIGLDLKNGDPPGETVFPLATAFGVALMLILPFWDRNWLVPSFFGSLGALLGLSFLYLLSRIFVAKRVPWQAFVPTVAVFAYLAMILIYTSSLTRGVRSTLWDGVLYFFGGDLARMGVEEASPVFRVYDPFTLPTLGLVFALAGLALLIESARFSGFRKDHLLFLVWTVFSAALMASQVRFLYLFSISGSVLVALLFFRGAERVKASDRLQKVDSKVVESVIGVFLLVLLLPAAIGLSTIAEYQPEIAGDWHDSLEWLAKNTPPTEGFERPVEAGEYGILSWWDYGNWILYQSSRPVVANNFQAGAKDAARFFLSESEKDALDAIEKREVRYVITDVKTVYSKLPSVARWADEDPDSYVQVSADLDIITYEHSKRFLGTVLARLHLLDCADLGHFRLIYESNTSEGLYFSVSGVKVFEQVPGAKIIVKTPHDRPMGVILEIISNQGRRFQYYNSAMPVDGRCEITVPYSTEDRYGTHSVGPYLLGPVEDVTGGEAVEIEVSEEDVLQGRVIEVDF